MMTRYFADVSIQFIQYATNFVQFQFKAKTSTDDKVSSFWSADNKTYVAAKAIPGYGTLVYLAVAYKPELGWQASGFSSYEF